MILDGVAESTPLSFALSSEDLKKKFKTEHFQEFITTHDPKEWTIWMETKVEPTEDGEIETQRELRRMDSVQTL